ncbi:hypothetical protein FVB32_14865 [Flagellimonas hymeniacidonis]|uniref:DUF4870 domain-containing protein n=1 Tax=Flagellimonas hymeniacidonis TaxID=2603628 RepID=A0A5C8V393_9FLAO|nr:hypothetical protein [Flagellimonas hymeniacidonis]TXN35846.1 hypothetical protein FVB32_14865 [Flagellimonas hymeniacidonis]
MAKSNSGKTTAIISYITIVGCLIAITMNVEPKNSFARFHIRQAFGIHLLYHAFSIFLNYSGVNSGWTVLWVIYLASWIFGLVGAGTQKQQLLPVLGKYFQKWFTFIS